MDGIKSAEANLALMQEAVEEFPETLGDPGALRDFEWALDQIKQSIERQKEDYDPITDDDD